MFSEGRSIKILRRLKPAATSDYEIASLAMTGFTEYLPFKAVSLP